MVNKPLIRPYFLGGVALGGAARIPLIDLLVWWLEKNPKKSLNDGETWPK